MPGYAIFAFESLDYDRPSGGDQSREIVRISDSMRHMRANIWRMPPATRGRRHVERIQEEIFVALDGTTTLLLGEPPEAVELHRGSVVVVEPGTAIQVRNDHQVDSVVLIVGAPPETEQADYLPDVDR